MTELETVIAATDIPDEARELAETATRNGRRHISEPLIYDLDGPSYFKDLGLAAAGDLPAAERQERHRRQMDDAPRRSQLHLPGATYEYRVNPSTKTGQGGGAPPLWMNEYFATAKRPMQILQRLAPTFDLPKGVSSVNLPRITKGTVVEQDLDNSPQADEDVETATVTSEVTTFAGLSDWSIQALEQSPAGAHLDWAMFKDMTESVDAEVERELIIGTGKSERFFGLAELAGTNGVTYTSASPTGTELFLPIGQAMAKVGSKRFAPPEALLMTTSRLMWMATSETTTNQPLSFTDYPESAFPIVGLDGVGVYVDDAIPSTSGASKEQDVIIACRPSDFMILKGEPKPSVYLDVLSGTLQARFEYHHYIAALLGRYPSGISVISGTGLKVQEGFS